MPLSYDQAVIANLWNSWGRLNGLLGENTSSGISKSYWKWRWCDWSSELLSPPFTSRITFSGYRFRRNRRPGSINYSDNGEMVVHTLYLLVLYPDKKTWQYSFIVLLSCSPLLYFSCNCFYVGHGTINKKRNTGYIPLFVRYRNFYSDFFHINYVTHEKIGPINYCHRFNIVCKCTGYRYG